MKTITRHKDAFITICDSCGQRSETENYYDGTDTWKLCAECMPTKKQPGRAKEELWKSK